MVADGEPIHLALALGFGGTVAEMSGNWVLGPCCPEGPCSVTRPPRPLTGLLFTSVRARAGKNREKVMGSSDKSSLVPVLRAPTARAAGPPRCWGEDVCPHTGHSLSSGTQRTPRTHGVPWTKGSPGEYTAFSLWGWPRISQRCWIFPEAPVASWQLAGGEGDLPGSSGWRELLLGSMDPSFI